MKKPIVIENYADNGEHSHYSLINQETGDLLWSEAPEEETQQVKNLNTPPVSKCVKPVRKPAVCKHKKKYLIASIDGWRCPDCYEILA